jgi:FSR family fosmidomycin resistance protein-like MFS transporter
MAQTATFPTPVQLSLRVLTGISVCHLLNDLVQSLLPSIYPILKSSFHLTFGEIGFVTLAYQLTASLLQPFVGQYTDKRPLPYSLPFAMAFTLVGLILMGLAFNLSSLLLAAVLIGLGSAIFHPESSRVARLASGGQHGLAQSFFQVGGNAGSAIGPLLAAVIVQPRGQIGVLWFSIAALLAIPLLLRVARWYASVHVERPVAVSGATKKATAVPTRQLTFALVLLLVLIFSKYFYLASISNFYIFYLIEHFGVSVQSAQIHLFVFLGAVAAGTLVGGPVGDRYGRKLVILGSIFGVLPFTLILPHANLFWTGPLTFIIGFILSSAFSAILVYGQELIPGRIGMVSGLFFGFAFGMGGIGAAVLGHLADAFGVITVYKIAAWLPALGLFAILLPRVEHDRAR